jgi:hypothetical protein
LADHLDEATRQLGIEVAAQQEADAEMEALRTSAAWVHDLVLDSVEGPSSLPTSVSGSVLVATVSYFPELKSDLELLGSGCNADLAEDEADALWTQVHMASDSLALYVPSLVALLPFENRENRCKIFWC